MRRAAPTEIPTAVALRYRADLPAPFLAAKASGFAAERLVELARKSGVPVLRDEALAQLVFPLDVWELVPEEYFEIVARVFAFVKTVEEA